MLSNENLSSFRQCPPYKVGVGLPEPVAINDKNNNGSDYDHLALPFPAECPGSTDLFKASVVPSLR